jgi:hypothetical protein
MGLSRLGGFELAGRRAGSQFSCGSHVQGEEGILKGVRVLSSRISFGCFRHQQSWRAGSRIDCPAQTFYMYLTRNIRKATSIVRGTLSHKTLALIINQLIKLLLTVRGLPKSRKRSHHHVRVFQYSTDFCINYPIAAQRSITGLGWFSPRQSTTPLFSKPCLIGGCHFCYRG